MKLIDRLVVKELYGPWIFGVGMFTALLLAGTYLGRIAGFIAEGAALADVGRLFMLLVPAMLVKTFAMAMLLGALLAFGRLSGDSEVVALHAGGTGIGRLVRPVVGFALVVAVLSFFFNERVVPGAVTEGFALTEKLVKAKAGSSSRKQSFAKDIVQDGKLKLAFVASDVNPETGIMRGVVATSFDAVGKPAWTMYADAVEFSSETNWRVMGETRMISGDFSQVVGVREGFWPQNQIAAPTRSLKDLLSQRNDAADSLSMAELKIKIDKAKLNRDQDASTIANWEYWYWNKLALPLASVVFGMLGAVMGVRKARTGAAAGFSLSIGIIFGYVTLSNFMNVWAMGGVMPAWAATFLPLVMCAGLAGFVAWRRNL